MAFVFVTLVTSTGSVKADQIDRVMVQDASAITKAVSSLKARNVAVLPFQVKFGDAPASFQAGSMGIEMLNRMENLLVLGLSSKVPELDRFENTEPTAEFNLLAKADQTAVSLARELKTPIDWTTVDGRKKLLGMKLPVIWNEKEIYTPDAFVTGIVWVSKDYREVKIELKAFTKAEQIKALGTLGERENGQPRGIRTDRSILASLGLTFSTNRKLKPTGKARDFIAGDEGAIEDAAKRADLATPATEVGPVKLEILLDGTLANLEPDQDRPGSFKIAAKLANSLAKRQLSFMIENTGTETLAVLLCVDGKNTVALDNETLDSPDKSRSKFRMFVLSPKIKYTIPGFLMNETGAIEPIVLRAGSEAESFANSLNHRGKIQMFVYGKAPLPIPNANGAEAKLADQLEERIDDAFFAGGLSVSVQGLGTSGNYKTAQRKAIAQTKIYMRDGKLTRPGTGRPPLYFETKLDPNFNDKFRYDYLPLDSLQITYPTP